MSCISIDWFQISVTIKSKALFELENSTNNVFKITKKDIRHNVFKHHREIHSNISGVWEVCAVFSYEPLSEILPANIGHLKIINKYLYQTDLQQLVNMLLISLHLKFKAVSRMDIALDFKKFNHLTVPQFFKGVASGKILKRKCRSLHIDGKATRTLNIHYMRFGSNSSPLQFYIYNKSKELREKTDKPYIRDKWNACGIGSTTDTYRIEFVIHPSQFGVVDMNGEFVQFNDTTITKQRFVEELFWTLFNMHFVFVKNDGQVKKSRMKTYQLFKSLKKGRPKKSICALLKKQLRIGWIKYSSSDCMNSMRRGGRRTRICSRWMTLSMLS